VSSLLTVQDLHTEIRMRETTVFAVDGVSFDVQQGETVGLVGETGCGKSMTGMSVMRLLPPGGRITSGTITLDGLDITAYSRPELRQMRGRDIAMVFQDPMTALNPTMTIGRQIAESVRIHERAPRTVARRRAIEVLSLVGMPRPEERIDNYPHQLSGGLRQRAVLAIALAANPKLLIADEPTTALDVTIQAQILALLDDLKEQLHMGLLLITHDMGVIAQHADRVLVMYAGRIVEAGTTSAVFRKTRHPYAEALFESMPSLEATKISPLYSIPGAPPDLTDPPRHCRFAARCRYAQDNCRASAPVSEYDDTGHMVACFHPLKVSDLAEKQHRHAAAAAEAPAQPAPEVRNPAPVGLGSPDGKPESAEAPELPAGGPPPAGLGGREAAPLLVLEDVTKRFPIRKGVLQLERGAVQAVSGISLEVREGETFGLVGESGCGKSTLGRIVTALEKPDSGSVRLEGRELTRLRGAELRAIRKDVQLMFQDTQASLDPRMRIGASLREPLAAQSVGTREDRHERIRMLLENVGLPANAVERYPHEFSGGQRQRIGLARAVTLGPRLIVADEPVSALDVSVKSQVLNWMLKIQAEYSLTYVLISHDLGIVRYIADRIGVMYLGKLVEVGPTNEVYKHPSHPYTAALLAAVPAAIPRAEGSRRLAPVIRGELPSAADPPSGCRFRTRCPQAQTVCAEVEPSLEKEGAAGHVVACHFPLRTGGLLQRVGARPDIAQDSVKDLDTP
jgi:oligopeptide/dipeptide ABC transporter ATP-binding protein